MVLLLLIASASSQAATDMSRAKYGGYMRSIVCTAYGTDDNLVLDEGPTPEPGAGQVRVAVKAAGASFVDALQAAGKYQFVAQPPYVPGGEAAGVVDAVGEGVTDWEVGDRVVASIGKGAFADHIVALPQQLIRLPESIDLAIGASFLQVYGTAWFAFKKRTVVRPGEVVLVTGAGGGVGLAAVDVARSLGARVIAVASSEEKRALARRLGAEAVIDPLTEDVKTRACELTDGAGVDIVYDVAGGDVSEPALRALRFDGAVDLPDRDRGHHGQGARCDRDRGRGRDPAAARAGGSARTGRGRAGLTAGGEGRGHARRDSGRDAATEPAGHPQGLPVGGRQRRHRPRSRPRRDPRRARRERRGQVHADEDHLRRGGPRCGRDPLGGPPGGDRQPARRARPRHRDGVPAFLAVRDPHRDRERRAGDRRCERPRGPRAAHRGGVATLRPAPRSAAARALALGRRAPARGDRALPAAAAAAADHGRADLGAHAAGGAEALRDAAPARVRGVLDPVHQPQARRDQGALHRRDGAARRQGHRQLRSAQRDRVLDGADS